MDKNIFNPTFQNQSTSGKIVAGLERISEAFKVLLWEKGKEFGLSPIQIQIIIFVAYHKKELCNVSHLALEFNITKPTISDAIKALEAKKLITKKVSPSDSRRYTIQLSEAGKSIVSKTEDFANPITSLLNGLDEANLESLFETISTVIYQLNQNGIISAQRTCYGCKFYRSTENKDYCTLLETDLYKTDIRIDCPEFEAKLTA